MDNQRPYHPARTATASDRNHNSGHNVNYPADDDNSAASHYNATARDGNHDSSYHHVHYPTTDDDHPAVDFVGDI